MINYQNKKSNDHETMKEKRWDDKWIKWKMMVGCESMKGKSLEANERENDDKISK